MPIDIKNSKEVKPAHKRQLIFYIWILDALQGPGTVEGAIINRDGATLSVDLTDAKEHAKVAERCKDICAIKGGQRPPINVTSSAKSSPWFKLMLREAIKQQEYR